MLVFSTFVAFESILKANNLQRVKNVITHMYKNSNDCVLLNQKVHQVLIMEWTASAFNIKDHCLTVF